MNASLINRFECHSGAEPVSTALTLDAEARKWEERLTDPGWRLAQHVTHSVLGEVHRFFDEEGFLQFLPVMLSPVTDPLCHSVLDAGVEAYGQSFQLTRSLIVHKQLLVMEGGFHAVYCVSPNVRLEKPEVRCARRHLFEFCQVDFEWAGASMTDVFDLMERLYRRILLCVRDRLGERLPRRLDLPPGPFPVFDRAEELEELGPDHEGERSRRMEVPFWLVNHPREFYDREDPARPGTFLNYDLVLPGGFGEVLSGGERVWMEPEILHGMDRAGTPRGPFAHYLSLAGGGRLRSSAGGGFGVQRLVAYLVQERDVPCVSLFDRRPGEKVVF